MGKNQKLIIIIILGIVLRLVNINQSFWLDEASQAQLSSQTITQIWDGRNADFQPPLFYLLAHGWLKLGSSETWLRLLPVSFGVASIGAIYYLGRRLYGNERFGLIAAFLLAINSYHIYYSQEFRMYSVVMFLAIASVNLLLSRSKYLFVVNALLLYTHYLTILFILFQALYSLLIVKKPKWFISQLVLTGALFLPWLPHLNAQLSHGMSIDSYLPGWRQVLGLPAIKAIPEIIFKFVAGRITIFPRFIYFIYIAFVLAVTGFGIVIANKERRLLWMWVIVPLLASIVLSPLIPQTQTFRLIFILPALILIFAQACIKYPRLMITLLVYISIVGNILYYTRPRLQREQWRQALDFVSSKQGSVAVKFGDAFAPFLWYTPNLPVVGLVNKYPAIQQDTDQAVSKLVATEIYVFDYLSGLSDPGRNVEKSLQAFGYVNDTTYNYEGVGLIYHYYKP